LPKFAEVEWSRFSKIGQGNHPAAFKAKVDLQAAEKGQNQGENLEE
jgi:hypothetical protein